MIKMKRDDAITLINAFKRIDEPTEKEIAEKEEAVNLFIDEAKELLGDIKKQQLAELAEELTVMMQITEPPLKTTGTVDVLLAEVVEAGTLLYKGDTLSTEAIDILTQLGLVEFIKKAGIKIPEEEVDEEPEEEQQEQEGKEPEQEETMQYDDDTKDEPGEEEPEDEQSEPEDQQVHDEHLDDAIVVEETIQDGTLAGMTPDELIKLLEKVEDGKKTKHRKGNPNNPSPYMMAFDIICQFPDLTLKELSDAVAKKHDLEVTPKNLPGIRTARSIVQKVMARFREHGLATAKGAAAKRTTKKPAAKK